MEKINWKQKLSSRKLWVSIIGVIVGVAMTFGIQDGEWNEIAGAVTSIASIIAYILGEAKIDASRVEGEVINNAINNAATVEVTDTEH